MDARKHKDYVGYTHIVSLRDGHAQDFDRSGMEIASAVAERGEISGKGKKFS
ncbi:MAG: hypothetical protein NHB36_03460 [Nitrospira sp.]|nr:hypothetical protein [Nitrospira sp.]